MTIIVTSFNHERFLTQCLDTVAAQSYENLQVIICDDASTDSSQSTIVRWAERSAVDPLLLLHETNVGFAATLNEAFGYAEGEFIATISADDYMVRERVERQVQRFELEGSACGLVYSDVLWVDENGHSIPKAWPTAHHSGDVFSQLLSGLFVNSCSVMVRASVMDVVGGYDEELAIEDWDMWLRIARHYRIGYEQIPLVTKRKLSTSLFHSMPQARRAEAQTLTLEKQIGISRGTDRTIARRIARNEGPRLYRYSDDSSLTRRALWFSLRKRPTVRAAGCLIGSLLHLDPEWVMGHRESLLRR